MCARARNRISRHCVPFASVRTTSAISRNLDHIIRVPAHTASLFRVRPFPRIFPPFSLQFHSRGEFYDSEAGGFDGDEEEGDGSRRASEDRDPSLASVVESVLRVCLFAGH